MPKNKITAKDYTPEHPIDWCPGCGDFGILNALRQALAKQGLPPHQVALVGGIGCSGKAQYHIGAYSVHTLHGRLLPYATGIKLANPQLTVVAVGGDGDGMAIGAGHFVNAGRRNVDLTYILFNNEVYGLTKGQASPTLPLGLQTKSLPEPNMQGRVNSLMLALSSGFTWIGRGYAFNVRQLASLIRRAIDHPGLSFLEVAQPCPTYNNLHNKDWYRPRLYDVADEGYDPVVDENDDTDALWPRMGEFMQKAHEWGDRIPTGVFLENRAVPTFAQRLTRRSASYDQAPPAHRPIADAEGRPTADLNPFYKEMMIEP
ncbi:MAG: thiamine pyrophosphate-dependent enzyme [Anaerolineae bacterium]|jgi:2-oxoglutarate ferredoxin oxidoreductase subunit beta